MAKIGVIHYNLRDFNFDEFLDYAARTGFEYVELQSPDVWAEGTVDPVANAESVRKKVDAAGLKVSALAAQNDFVVLDPDIVRRQVERMKTIAQCALALGTNVIRTEGGQPKAAVPEERHVEAMAGCLKRCMEWAEDMDIYLAVDNHGLVTNDADLQVELFQAVGSKHVGANVDTMNYRWAGHSLEEIDRFYEIIAPYALHTHLKDGTGSRSEYRGAVLGEGEIHLDKAIQCLRDAGYDGVWCAEYEGREIPPPEGYALCCEWMKKNL